MWPKILTAFAVWIAYGVFQARRSVTIRAKVSLMPRNLRIAWGAGLMVVGIAALFGGLVMLHSFDGLAGGDLSLLGWLGVAAVGLVCVHCQTLAMAMLVSVALESVTKPAAPSSTSSDPQTETQT